LRGDPAAYDALKKRVQAASTDQEKADVLVGFATDYLQLRQQMPEFAKTDFAATNITTVGITTTIV